MKTHIKLILGISIPLVFVVMAAAVYFFMIRTADSDYQAANRSVETLKKDATAIAKILGNTSPPFFSDKSSLDSFTTTVKSYNDTVAILSSAQAIQKDGKVKSLFADKKTILQTYGTTAATTAKAFSIYYDILASCGVLRFNSAAELSSTQLADCNTAITAESALPSSGFKSQFLDAYTKHISEAAVVYISSTPQATKKTQIAAIQNTIETLYRDTSIDYKQGSSPINALNELASTLAAQQKTLFR